VKNNQAFAWTAVAVLVVGMIAGVAGVANGQQAATGSAAGKRWLGLMDTDNDATVSKQEFLNYMSAQFDGADVDHDGTLDAAELTQLRKALLK
jgi:hypothetical protein